MRGGKKEESGDVAWDTRGARRGVELYGVDGWGMSWSMWFVCRGVAYSRLGGEIPTMVETKRGFRNWTRVWGRAKVRRGGDMLEVWGFGNL